MRIGPVGKVHHSPCPRVRLVRLDNIQSLAAEEGRKARCDRWQPTHCAGFRCRR
jgi:hypothetical protein